MATKKQTKKKKQATVKQPSHKDPEVLKNLYQQEGKSAGEIGRILGVSRAAVLFQMRKHDIPITTRKTKSADAKSDYQNKTWLTNQLKKGISIFAIAKDQKVTYTTVMNQTRKLVDAHVVEAGRELRKKQKAEAKKKTAKKST